MLYVYSAQVLDHFQNPRNTGDIPDPDATAQIENPACGDILKLTLRIVDGRIHDIRFRAKGCVSGHGVRIITHGISKRKDSWGGPHVKPGKLSKCDWRIAGSVVPRQPPCA